MAKSETKMKVTRVGVGMYDVRLNGVTYELERYPDGDWLLFTAAKIGSGSPREYMQHFATKRDALTTLSQEA